MLASVQLFFSIINSASTFELSEAFSFFASFSFFFWRINLLMFYWQASLIVAKQLVG